MANMTNFTRKNTIDIVDLIQKKQLSGRNLHRKERLGVVAFLRNEGKSQYEIARLLEVCDKTIWLDCKTLKKNAAQLVKEISVDRIAGDLIREADVLTGKAKKKDEYALAWRIRCELIDKLQSLGYIYKAPQELKHSGEIKSAEIKILTVINSKSEKEINELLTGNNREIKI